jgi:glycosyltransferase involved in cell wall biosynthesis
MGRFNPQKDPFTFIRAAQLIVARLPGVQFIVCGDDPLEPSLEAEARALAIELGLSEVMHFLGFRRDVTNTLRSVDMLMHSSRYEGMGRVICEALACERPVAGTAVDGVAEVIDSGRRGGLLVPPGEPIALAEATLRLLQNKVLARDLARTGCQWVMQKLSAEVMVREIESVYRELLDGR